jgi:hypothetical protein
MPYELNEMEQYVNRLYYGWMGLPQLSHRPHTLEFGFTPDGDLQIDMEWMEVLLVSYKCEFR